jgi:small conductance mechanosensitive channel
MTRSPSVFAVDGESSAVPACADSWRCRELSDRSGMDWPAENARVLVADGQATERRTQRAEATGAVLRSFASIVVLGIAVVLVLGELGIDLAPIAASAGVVGLLPPAGSRRERATGGEQAVLPQYGVGDVVDLGEASGTVEAVGLPITRPRDVDGGVRYVRNGEIPRVGNRSRGVARVIIDIPVAHATDRARARAVMQEVADAMDAHAEWAVVLLAAPETPGVEQITSGGVFLRRQVRSTDADQWRVGCQLRMRLEERFVASNGSGPVVR